MKPGAPTGPPIFAVQRQFAGQRMAKDCEARTYEEVFPLDGRSATRGVEADAHEWNLEPRDLVALGGAA